MNTVHEQNDLVVDFSAFSGRDPGFKNNLCHVFLNNNQHTNGQVLWQCKV